MTNNTIGSIVRTTLRMNLYILIQMLIVTRIIEVVTEGVVELNLLLMVMNLYLLVKMVALTGMEGVVQLNLLLIVPTLNLLCNLVLIFVVEKLLRILHQDLCM